MSLISFAISSFTLLLFLIIPWLKQGAKLEKEKTVIVVADFHGVTEKEKEEGQRIAALLRSDLDSKLKKANIERYTKVFPLGKALLSEAEAREIATEIGESVIVLWGQMTVEQDKKFFTPNFCIINPPRGMIQPTSKRSQIISDFEGFKLKSEKLSKQVVNIASLIIGLIHYWDENYEKAKKCFQELYTNIDEPYVFFYSGNCHYYLSEIDSAIIAYDILIQKNNNEPAAYNNLGICYTC